MSEGTHELTGGGLDGEEIPPGSSAIRSLSDACE
jgi:hypothetical protein